MMLRTVVLICALGAVAIGVWLTAEDLAAWPALAFPALVVAGTLFERFYYRGNATDAAPQGWRETGELFIDDETGGPVTVWFNATTGERQYRQD
jgi:hypothetical protein